MGKQRNAKRAHPPRLVRWLAQLGALAAGLVLACGQPGVGVADGGGSAEVSAALAKARAHGLPGAPVLSRAEALALGHGLEAAARDEGTSARAFELHLAAARLMERTFRHHGREQDAKEAAEIFLLAARDRQSPDACGAALRGAHLFGEAVRDPAAAYKELYRSELRLTGKGAAVDGGRRDAAPTADPACVARLMVARAALDAFKPSALVLEAVVHGVASEGEMPPSAAAVPVAPPRVVRIDAWPGPEATRVVIELDRPVTFRVGDEGQEGGRGARTFVDLDGVTAPDRRETKLVGVVARVLAGATSTGARVAMDLDGPGYRRVFHLLEPYRVVVDVARRPPDSRGRRSVSRVLLDPGHGGVDPGAIGAAGLKEKDVTVDVARRAAKVLSADGLTVLLTRDDDRTVSLEQRAALANGAAADLFVSIHCNAAENRAKRGVETYVLDTASDVVAGRVAARENATSVAAGAEIGSILASLRLSDHAKSSVRLAELMQRAALASVRSGYPDVHDGGVHRAGFYVLVGARMPSVLFETSYISNETEEAKLGDESYRQRLAEAVANAIKAYREGR